MKNIFTEHPKEQNLTYWQHFGRAFYFAMTAFFLGFVALLHSLFPFVCKTTFSNKICKLAQKFSEEEQSKS